MRSTRLAFFSALALSGAILQIALVVAGDAGAGTVRDLCVASYGYGGSARRAGRLFSGRAVIKTRGSAPTSTSTARLRIDVGSDGAWDVALDQSTPALDPRSVAKWTRVWTTQEGHHRFEMCADANGVQVELNEDNNCVNQTFNVGKASTLDYGIQPDIIVERTRVFPRFVDEGRAVSFRVRIRNQSLTTVPETTTTLRLDIGNDGSWDYVLPALAGSLASRHTVSLRWNAVWTASPGVHRFEITADSGQVVGESDETNNIAWGSFVTTPASPPPNVVLILTDDQRFDSLDYMPAVSNRLSTGGAASFTNAFVPTSACCPSRASILTGRYLNDIDLGNVVPSQGPVVPAVGFHESGEDADTLAVWLQAAGYRTALVGKYMNGNGDLAPTVPPGWDEWFTFTVYGYSPQIAEYNHDGLIVGGQDYSTDELRDRAVDFIADHPEEEFFLVFAPFAPHADGTGHPTPAARHDGVLAGLPPYAGGAYPEDDIGDKPMWMQLFLHFGSAQHAFLQLHHRKRLESLLAVDEAVDAILDALDAAGCDENTVVIYTSDNGYLLGDHHYIQKLLAYEPSIRVPLIVRFPGRIGEARSDDHLALNLDLPATILDLVGLPIPPMAGRSLVPFLDGRSAPWRQDFLLEYLSPLFPGPLEYVGVRTLTHKYVLTFDFWSGGEFEELYDLTTDADELSNLLVTAPGVHDALAETLRARALALQAEE